MKLQLIRHGTVIIYLNNKKILIDPVLSPKNTIAPIPDVENQTFNPLVDLPIKIDDIINCDAVLITHTHEDHFDDNAANVIPKNVPMFCQPEDKLKLEALGFSNVHAICDFYIWNEITINKTSGEHGHGELALKMAPVSGFVLSCKKEPSIYIAGDTVWCSKVKEAIEKFKPEIMVCNCGGAHFSFGEPITMTGKDISEISNNFPNIKIAAVHMDSWNHCSFSRKDLKYYIDKNHIKASVVIPQDGEILNF